MTVNGNGCLTCKVRKSSVLEPCAIGTLSAISTFKNSRKFEKGEFLFKEGEEVKGVFFIKKGVVKVLKEVPGYRTLIFKVCAKGEIVGHRGYDSKNIHKYSGVALSETECCFVPIVFFKEILRDSPDLEKQLMEEYLIDLERMEQKSMSLAYKSVKEKVAEAILLVSGVYDYHVKRRSFNIDLSRQDFADLTGTTKEQVSAVLKEFSRDSLIRYSGKKFNFIDLDALKSVAATY
ncbi:MAG: Crp/Fnr family transcriptional regulator [Chitinophagaceae bacterium]|nr:Crp/Fnr family transcriptional regulator [Chitinophagaceae bacterium]MCW5914409.1 Crp/Fnr family transcriptional regulator [Chitinophagaceae bacterium]MCZ2397193.1 Crp/Fnr family transcriptional regulator [Chitinophagales bacterium]